MVQRKKDTVRAAILAAAFQLFTQKGYSDTTMPAIARKAGISTANVYVYFGSKMQILFTLFTPWLEERLDKLDAVLTRIADPELRLKRLLTVLWRDLPREDNGFAHNLVEAVSSNGSRLEYSPELRERFVKRVAKWLQDCTSLDNKDCQYASTVMVMAFDGFAANVSLEHGVACNSGVVELFSGFLLGQIAGGRRIGGGARSAAAGDQ